MFGHKYLFITIALNYDWYNGGLKRDAVYNAVFILYFTNDNIRLIDGVMTLLKQERF